MHLFSYTPVLIALFAITLLPSTFADNGTFEGEYEGSWSGSSSIESKRQEAQVICANHAFNSVACTGNFTPLETKGLNESRSFVIVEWHVTVKLAPTGIQGAEYSAGPRIDGGQIGECGEFDASKDAGGGSEHVSGSFFCLIAMQTGTHTISINTTSSQNIQHLHPSLKVTQYLLYDQNSSFTISGSNSGLTAGTVSNASFNGSSSELMDHNVTIIDGDSNLPEMRVYAWIIGVTLFFVIMGEWRNDVMYYFLAMLSGILAVLQMPDFLPGLVRGLGIALLAYMAVRMYQVYSQPSSSPPSQS